MARSAVDAIREQARQRYGIDVDALGTDAEGVAALNEAAQTKTQAQEERTAASGKNAQVAQLLAEAERADKAQGQNVEAENAQPEQLTEDAAVTYVSAVRREPLANSPDHIGTRKP